MQPTIEILDRIRKNSRDNKEEIFTRLYRYLLRPDLYYLAYKNLYANKGAGTKGTPAPLAARIRHAISSPFCASATTSAGPPILKVVSRFISTSLSSLSSGSSPLKICIISLPDIHFSKHNIAILKAEYSHILFYIIFAF